MKYDFIKELIGFAKNNKLYHYVEKALEQYNNRRKGKKFLLEDHLRAIIYSLLSSQRPWRRIEENKPKIDEIFFNFDVNKIKRTAPNHFIDSLTKINCGNRNIRKQMEGLKEIISVLEKIEKAHGLVDIYYYNHPYMKEGYPYCLAKELADSENKFKLKNMGVALVCEYFKNIGIDIAKPDTHITRMLGKDILGFSDKKTAAPGETVRIVKEIADYNNIPQIEADALLWLYCSEGYGEICTKDYPRCSECVIKKYCNKGNTH